MPVALQSSWKIMGNWATMIFAPGRMQTVPEEFTEIHSTLMLASLARRPLASAESPDSGFPFSQARANGTGKPCLGSKWLD